MRARCSCGVEIEVSGTPTVLHQHWDVRAIAECEERRIIRAKNPQGPSVDIKCPRMAEAVRRLAGTLQRL